MREKASRHRSHEPPGFDAGGDGTARSRAEEEDMILWARTVAIAAIVLVWIGVRIALRRPVLHPWLTGFILMGVTTALTDLSQITVGLAHALVWTSTGIVFFFAILAFVEGMRREIGAPPATRVQVVAACAAAVALGLVCSVLPNGRGEAVGGIIGAAVLLNFVFPLLSVARRRIGAWVLAAGMVIYAAGRTAWVVALQSAANAAGVHLTADVLAIAVAGLGFIVYDVESVRAAQTVGGRSTAA